MKNRFEKLLTVKSIVTIILTCVFSYLAIKGDVSTIKDVFLIIIGFYFGTQKVDEK